MTKAGPISNVLRGIAGGFALLLALPAAGQTSAERLARSGSGNPARAALTSLAPLYAEFGAMSVELVDLALCSKGPAGDIVASAARTVFYQRYGNAPRPAKLEEADRLQLAIAIAAAVDGVDVEAIRRDEAIGPGAYRPIILLLSGTLERCKSLGA